MVAVLKTVVGRCANDCTLDSAVTGQTGASGRFGDIVTEVNDARIWAGFHFRSSTDDGAKIGRRVASLVLHRAFERADED